MARRSNFIEGNDNFREQNLRFVRNEFEDNINQFFGGANPGGGGNQQKPPPRDSLIVQPTPGGPPDHSEPGRNLELDTRRQFIRDLGASRMTAHALAVRSFKVPDFNLRYFQRQRFRLSVELGDSRQNVVDAEVLRAIGEALENREPDLESRPRTPSPPRNIDWHNVNRDDSPVGNDNRSRPRNRQGVDDFRGGRDNHQAPELEREPFNRNTGPKNAPNNRYNRNLNGDNRNTNPDEFHRNNRNAQPHEFNRNNRNANNQEFNRYNRNSDEFNRNNRNSDGFNRNNRNSDEFNRNNRNPNPQQEFHRGNHNANPQREFNPNIPNENPQINRNNRNVNPEMNHNNRNVNPQALNRNPNRNPSNDEFNRNNRNNNRPEIIRNNRNANPQEFNRNIIPQGNRNQQQNPREGPQNFNPNANPEGNPNIRGPPPNPRGIPQNFKNSRFNNNNNNRGNNDFIPNQQGNLDRNSMIDQRRDIDDNFLESRDRQQLQSHSDFRQLQPNFAGNSGPPQIGRNYQRIVNNNQITICRADWIEAKRREQELDRNLNDDGPFLDDDDRFHRPQQDNFRRPGFRGPEDLLIDPNQDDYDGSFEGNPGNFRNQSHSDPNFRGRDRNDRHFDGNRRQFNDRARSNDSDTFRGSPNRYERNADRGSGPGDRYQRDRSPHPANPNQSRPTRSIDRTRARNTNSSGRNPRSTSKVSQERNPARTTSSVGPKQPRTNPDRSPRSTSLASQNRSTSGSQKLSQDRSVPRKVKPGDGNLKKPMGPGQKKVLIKPKPSGVPPSNRGSTQTKPNQPAGEAKNTSAAPTKASTSNQARKNATTSIAGQKRKAETRESESQASSSNRSTKVEIKRKKITPAQPEPEDFIIGGYRLPYINNHKKKLPQSEDKSYAVTFFEQTPIYNTNIYAIDDGQSDAPDEEEESDAESVDSNQSGGKKNKPNLKKKIRNKLRKEWMVIYRENNYKDWYTWWKDYKWCGNEINKKLAKLGDRSVRHRFIPKYPSTEVMVREVFKCGHFGLEKNTFSHYRNMRSIFLLMNETFLEALSEEQQEKVQNLIRGVPNHLWLYKIRSMVYLWERYHRVLKTLDETKIHKENELKSMAREWKNPVFHWLAKQAFDELKAISGVAWPEHNELYRGIRICVKSFKVNSNEKFFINVCLAPEVPAPEDVTEDELIAILESTTPGSFRVPMSISEPRHTKDRSDKTVDVCDIAINPKFLVKIQKSQLFNNFFLQIVAEAMSEKYNVQLNMTKTITLNNRKFIGTLVSHRVRNDDVKRAQGPGVAAITGQDQAAAGAPDKSGKLVQEINEKDAAAIRQIRSSAGGGRELQYKLRARVRDETVDEIHAEIYLPNCVSSQEVNLDVGEDRILVESHKHGYVFDKFVNYRLQQDRAQALFDKTSKMLQIRIPVLTN